MNRFLPLFVCILFCRITSAEEVSLSCRLTGLFRPDRVEDLKLHATPLRLNQEDPASTVTLGDVDYEKALVTFRYDSASPYFKNLKPQQVFERINNQLRSLSRGSFTLSPPSEPPPGGYQEEIIVVAGLDCKGCEYNAYKAVAEIPGVERAVVSFKTGLVTAWLDPSRTGREALVAALEKAHVTVVKPTN